MEMGSWDYFITRYSPETIMWSTLLRIELPFDGIDQSLVTSTRRSVLILNILIIFLLIEVLTNRSFNSRKELK